MTDHEIDHRALVGVIKLAPRPCLEGVRRQLPMRMAVDQADTAELRAGGDLNEQIAARAQADRREQPAVGAFEPRFIIQNPVDVVALETGADTEQIQRRVGKPARREQRSADRHRIEIVAIALEQKGRPVGQDADPLPLRHRRDCPGCRRREDARFGVLLEAESIRMRHWSIHQFAAIGRPPGETGSSRVAARRRRA